MERALSHIASELFPAVGETCPSLCVPLPAILPVVSVTSFSPLKITACRPPPILTLSFRHPPITGLQGCCRHAGRSGRDQGGDFLPKPVVKSMGTESCILQVLYQTGRRVLFKRSNPICTQLCSTQAWKHLCLLAKAQ